MSEDHNDVHRSRYSLIASSSFVMQTWLFRTVIIAIAFLTVALCNWLIKESASPVLEAVPAAAGLILGFAIMHLFESRKYTK